MSDIEDIRRQKREQLRQRSTDETDSEVPTQPIQVESVKQFQELTETFGTVLVDFYAEWCGPCKQMEPTVEQVARETDAAVAKVDIDSFQELAQRHQVRGVPTVVLYADGEPVDQSVGLQSPAQLTALVEQYT